VHDLRPLVEQALRGSPILPADFISIRYNLQRARALNRALSRIADRFPHVADVVMRMDAPQSIIEEIGRCIDERGEVLDSASDALGRIRRELREAHARLMERLQRIVATPGNQPYLQEAIVTQRQGRYVIPLRAEFKVASLASRCGRTCSPIRSGRSRWSRASTRSGAPVRIVARPRHHNFSSPTSPSAGTRRRRRSPRTSSSADVEGMSVLTAWAAGKFTGESISKMLAECGIAEKGDPPDPHPSRHGRARLSGRIEELSGWRVLVGPQESSASVVPAPPPAGCLPPVHG